MASFFDTVLNEVAKVLGLRTEPQLAVTPGHTMITTTKPYDVRDVPLSEADLMRAKIRLARKFDASWEDR